MTYKFLTAGVLVVIAAASTPAEKHDFWGKCAKPDVLQNVAAGDKEGHTFFLQQGKCETLLEKWLVRKANGESLASAAKLRERNRGAGATRFSILIKPQERLRTAHPSPAEQISDYPRNWEMKGIKGAGSCKLTGNAGGGLYFCCPGDTP
jgi:hypothetical protein